MKRIILVLAFVISSCSSEPLNKNFVYLNNITGWNQNEQQLFEMINDYRISEGKTELEPNSFLYALSIDRNLQMAELGFITHDGIGKLIEKANGNGISNLSENLGYKYTSIENVFNAWKNSSSHNANMLKGKEISAISILYSDGEYYYCELFGNKNN